MINIEKQKTQNIQRRVIWNTLTNYVGKIVNLGTWFFLTPFVLRSLGQSVYGLWILVGSLTSYGSLFDFGIASAITKYVAEYYTRKEYDKAHKLVATALWLYMASGLVVILVGAIIAPFVPKIFNIPPDEWTMSTWVVFLSGIGLGISLPCATPIAVLRGLQRFDLVNVISIVGTLLYALAVLIILLTGGGLIGMIAANIPLTLLMQIPTIWFIYKIAPELGFGRPRLEKSYVKTVASFSSALFIINISGQLQNETDEVVIGSNLPISSITPYSIAHRLSTIPQILTDQFMKVLMPLASQLHSENDHSRLRLLYLTSTRLTLAIFTVLGFSIVILARPFLTIWVGPQYAGVGTLVLILTAASMLSTIMWPAGAVLQGMARHRLLAFTSLGTGIANLILTLFFVRRIGVEGVALGTLIPTTFEFFFLVMPYTWRVLQIKFMTAIRQIFLPALIPAVPMIILLFVLRQVLDPSSLVMIALIGGLAAIVYLAIYLWISPRSQENQMFFNISKKVFRTGWDKLRGRDIKKPTVL